MKKSTLYAISAGICLAIGCYALVAVLQATVLFEGERVASNLRFWGPLTLLFIGLGVFFVVRAIRYSLLQLKAQIRKDFS